MAILPSRFWLNSSAYQGQTRARESIIRQKLGYDDVGYDRCFSRVFDRYIIIKHLMGFMRNSYDVSAPRFHLHGSCEICSIRFVVGQECYARSALFYKRDYAVFEFTCGKSLRMDVGNFFDFQRRFQGCRIAQTRPIT